MAAGGEKPWKEVKFNSYLDVPAASTAASSSSPSAALLPGVQAASRLFPGRKEIIKRRDQCPYLSCCCFVQSCDGST
eukprot:SAG31_NODE_3871_length_3796_cov_3.386696_3_plen_77_part_00